MVVFILEMFVFIVSADIFRNAIINTELFFFFFMWWKGGASVGQEQDKGSVDRGT